MPETKQLLRETRDRIAPPPDVLGGLERRRRHRENVRRGAAAVVAIGVALVGLGGWFVLDRDAAPRPADDRSEELGIFAPVAGRILYENGAEGGDIGYDPGLWAIDPSGPSDAVEGRRVADDVTSTLVPLDLEDATPLGWSRDGTELLFMRTDGDSLFPKEYLYILHADGSETRLNEDPMYFGGATISPDGTRVVFAVQAVPAADLGLYVVDAGGGEPARLPLPGVEGIVMSPTFSPDGTQIAYVDSGNRNHVWVMDADGGNAREILANEAIVPGENLQWSPAGDRIAGVARSSEGTDAIYTFAPDGSDFRQVITYGLSPFWSPDGSQFAYTIECPELTSPSCLGGGSAGLAIADADGSNVREFGFAASGPWHPGIAAETPEPTPDETPAPDEGLLQANGEVLGFTGEPGGGPGDLVAVDPGSGEERVLVEDLETVYSARWSADGRWVAYEAPGPEGIGLWVVSASQEPRQVATGASMLAWSSSGAQLATIRLTASLNANTAGSTLSTIDPLTGETTDVGPIPEDVGDVTSAPAWSPDGTRFVFGARGGALYSIDVPSGARSLLVRLPGEHLDSVDQIVWSPDGAHIAVVNDGEPGGVYVMDADGSNVRVLLDGYGGAGVAWSPDGTRLAYEDGSRPVVWVASMDGSAPTTIGPLSASCSALLCQEDLVWSPDGSRIALRSAGQGSVDVSAIDADGQGDAERIDELTYRSWNGGSYSCEC
jgi:Tol biopolymer transport system component